MFINKSLDNVYVKCINLRNRRDKKLYMKKVFKKQNIEENFYMANLHQNPKRGCLESHYNIIQEAISKNKKFVLILEDDVIFKRKLSSLPIPPDNWDMIYLGGTVKNVLEDVSQNWSRVQTWTTHAYIINLTNKELINSLNNMLEWNEEIDNFYVDIIHPKFNAYMIKPMMCIQKDGYSDIEKSNVKYDFMEQTLEGLRKPRHTLEEEGYRMHLSEYNQDELPKVSIVTITKNRKHFLPLALTNWEHFDYPRNKLEWIIVEEECENNWENITEIIRDSKYIKLKGEYSIPQKRNIGCENASGEIICFMDDDDYYPPESILTRVRLLMEYKDIVIVGSSMLGAYDIINKKSGYVSDGQLSIAEASMGFRKKAWEMQTFNEREKIGEWRSFIAGRINKVMDAPYCFIIVALNHYGNISEKEVKQQNNLDLTLLFNEETKRVIEKTSDFLYKTRVLT